MTEKSSGGAPLGSANARVHGTFAVQERGPAALSPELRDRELQFLEHMGSHEGIMAELAEAAHKQFAVVEQGFAYLAQVAREGKNPWGAGKSGEPVGVLRMLGSWQNGYIRTLVKLAELNHDAQAVDMSVAMSQLTEGGADGAD